MPLPISPAVITGDLMFISGQLGFDKSGKLVKGGAEAEARQCLENMGEILKAQGLTFKDVVKCTIFLTDIKDFPGFNNVYSEYFPERFPSRSAFVVSKLALNATVEVECIASFRKIIHPISKL